MDIDTKNNRMVVTIENPDGLLLIDLASKKVLRKYDVKGGDPHMVILAPDGKTAYVSNTASKTLAAVNLDSGDVSLIQTDDRPQGSLGFTRREDNLPDQLRWQLDFHH